MKAPQDQPAFGEDCKEVQLQARDDGAFAGENRRVWLAHGQQAGSETNGQGRHARALVCRTLGRQRMMVTQAGRCGVAVETLLLLFDTSCCCCCCPGGPLGMSCRDRGGERPARNRSATQSSTHQPWTPLPESQPHHPPTLSPRCPLNTRSPVLPSQHTAHNPRSSSHATL